MSLDPHVCHSLHEAAEYCKHLRSLHEVTPHEAFTGVIPFISKAEPGEGVKLDTEYWLTEEGELLPKA